MDQQETLEQMQARHRREHKELQGRITNKKKNATKKTRKGVNDECVEMERVLRERQEGEVRALLGGGGGGDQTKEDEREERGEEEQDGGLVDGVTGDLGDLKITGESASGSQPQPQQRDTREEGGGDKGGKGKRNRQKERLARRAAELEAAALAAESEASNMVDRRGIERAYMDRAFRDHSLREKDIAPDGHCLFSAVADQLSVLDIALGGGDDDETKKEPGYRIVRRRAAEYIASHADDFAGFLEEDLEDYVAKIRDTAEWGGQLELSALASAYGVEIRVVQDGRTEVVSPREGQGETKGKTLWLAYYRHGYGLGEHYNSLRKAD
ncbi:hypothetical protein QBC47DRAFT_119658 [Echria macrotheca]|uniref:OTU domain-containing protein n=1 Tax=Echria macrotheca TaxID=438768 RepID=A0AAJ0B2T1_9PEZI|nr:hypothetical protein QBC47DRAFT_119658 [Echria macrotheca]